MNQKKPTFVLVPGAFHLHSCLDQVITELHAADYETRTGTLRSVNNAAASLSDDVTFIREELLLPLIETGKDVVVVFHSYAGVPGSAAIRGLSKSERDSKGQVFGIIGLIYMCALIPKDGSPLYDIKGGQWLPWQKVDVSLFPSRGFYSGLPLLRRRLGFCRCAPPRRSFTETFQILFVPKPSLRCIATQSKRSLLAHLVLLITLIQFTMVVVPTSAP